MKKISKARPNCPLTIQFYRDRQNTPNMLIIVNETGKDEPPTYMDASLFAAYLCDDNHLDSEWKKWLEIFCAGYVRNRNYETPAAPKRKTKSRSPLKKRA